MKELALDYFDCNRSSRIDDIIRHATQEIREWKSRTQIQEVETIKGEHILEDATSETSSSSCHSTVFEGSGLTCDICDFESRYDSRNWTELHQRLSGIKFSLVGCSHITWNVVRHLSVCCIKQTRTDFRREFHVKNQITSRLEQSRYRRLLEDHPHVMSGAALPRGNWFSKRDSNFTGLGCRTNRTLTFVVMDSLQYHDFFEKLGTKVLDNPAKTAVVIIHAKVVPFIEFVRPEVSESQKFCFAIIEPRWVHDNSISSFSLSLAAGIALYPNEANHHSHIK